MYRGVQTPVNIIWKDNNEAVHVAKHGIAFGVAATTFLDADRFEDQDTRDAYNPPRLNTVGFVSGVCVNVTFAMDGDVAIIISARPASRKERQRYAS